MRVVGPFVAFVSFVISFCLVRTARTRGSYSVRRRCYTFLDEKNRSYFIVLRASFSNGHSLEQKYELEERQ